MNDLEEYIVNRIAQAQSKGGSRGEHQVEKWVTLQKYLADDYLSFQEKLDFIRNSLESWRISPTTVDILFRRMIRWTLPGNVALECLTLPSKNGYLKKMVLSESTPGLAYTVTRDRCDCPGFRGNGHCKHHDEFIAESKMPSFEENYAAADSPRTAQEILAEWDAEGVIA